MRDLDQALAAARTFHPLFEQQFTALLAKTAPVSAGVHNPQWLG